MPEARLKLNLTKTSVEGIAPAPSGHRDYYNDTKVQGLQLVVTDTGAKTYYLYLRNGGKPVRWRLGRHPALTPENARRLAEAERGKAAMESTFDRRRRRASAARRLSQTHLTPINWPDRDLDLRPYTFTDDILKPRS
jgi:hypothetical protein